MRLDPIAGRRRRLSLTPLIDVIFLLLMFFMLGSSFTRFGAIDIATTSGLGSAAGQPDLVLTLAPGLWHIGDRSIAPEAAPQYLAQKAAAGAERVLILLDPKTDAQTLVTALREVEQAGLKPTVANGGRP